jgi:hypothetical protein
MITCKWLLPSFQLKYDQTKTKRRTPLWFKKMLNEWVTLNHKENLGSEVKYDIHKWICSCKEYLNSTFFLCRHLVKSTTIELRFYTDIIVRDNYPFILLTDNIGSESVDNIKSVTTPRCTRKEIIYKSPHEMDSSDMPNDYHEIKNLIEFLTINLEDIKFNNNQIRVLKNSLDKAFTYRISVEKYQDSRSIAKTWTDLDKYTMFL